MDNALLAGTRHCGYVMSRQNGTVTREKAWATRTRMKRTGIEMGVELFGRKDGLTKLSQMTKTTVGERSAAEG